MSWRRFFRRKRADAELAQEIDLYLAAEMEENLARGMSADEARRRAYVKFGNPQQVRESVWRGNTFSVIDNLWRDLKYAARMLTRAPGFAVVAVLVMALGIGANIALFTVVRSVLLNPLPYRDPARLYSLYERNTKDREGSDAMPTRAYLPVDAGSFAEWKRSVAGVAELAMVAVAGIQRFVRSRKTSRTDRGSVVLVEFLSYVGSRGHPHRCRRGNRDAEYNPPVRALLRNDLGGKRQWERYPCFAAGVVAHSGGRARAGLRKGLLILEVGLTVVLLIGAGLLLKSYERLRNTDLGVPVDNVLTMHFGLPDARYKDPTLVVAFFERLIERVRSLPEVQAAGLVSAAPGQGWNGDNLMSVVEHPPLPKGEGFDLMWRGADPGYFSAIQIPLVRGRIFTLDERLERAHVAVISQSAAQLLFPGEDPIGKHLKVTTGEQAFEVVGVVGDTRWSISQPMRPTFYLPLYGNGYSVATIVIRSERNVETLAVPVQKIIGEMDADLPVGNVMTLRETIGKSTIDSQFDSILVLAFAGIALLLAAAGLYGVLAYLVTQRTGEIGIRIALGAQRGRVLRVMLLDGLRPALLGLVLGLGASAVSVRLIRSMLYDTQPLDPAVFALVSGTLLAVAGVACLLPAWRASRLDPMQALRTE